MAYPHTDGWASVETMWLYDEVLKDASLYLTLSTIRDTVTATQLLIAEGYSLAGVLVPQLLDACTFGPPAEHETKAPIEPEGLFKMHKIETKHFFDGADIASMSDNEQFSAIMAIKDDIQNLKDMGVDSEKVNKRIASLETVLTDLIKHVDAS